MTPMSPWDWYQDRLSRDDFFEDTAQAAVVRSLDQVYRELMNAPSGKSWLGRLLPSSAPAVKGLYIWGSVGRGKTWMMDSFHDALTGISKRRVHFHRFMEDVHERLKAYKGKSDPLVDIGRQLASEARVLCFDEFFVSDIGDAMILAGLLDALFSEGVCLVATSNVVPDELYRNGLQRAKFLPAIELLKQHTSVVHLGDGQDFRLRILNDAEIYHTPSDDEAHRILDDAMSSLAPGSIEHDQTIHINLREIEVKAISDGIAWFDFDVLCRGSRSTQDYIEVARRFNTVLLSDVTGMTDDDNDTARRFVNMIDEFYDRRINLIIAADVEIPALYTGSRLAFEFDRTVSRLTEMQSTEYLACAHVC